MSQMGGPQAVNINQMMIRPLLQNVTVLVLFVLPMITMRTYSEEKRSGTIELLLTSPLTDLQIILGKFLGALALYARDARRHARSTSAILFIYGNPEWKPIATAYLGLLLLGGCFISLGLFISSLTKNQIVAGDDHLRGVPDAVDHHLDRQRHGPDGQRRSRPTSRSSSTSTTSAKGVIDTTHLIYYLSFITFGLFLTAKSVDSERWRG